MYDETVTVVENRPLTGGHFLLSVHSPRQARATRPGQFAMVRLLGRSDVLLRRPMSIYDVAPGSAGVPPAPVGGGRRPVAPVSPPAVPVMRTLPLQQAGGHRPPLQSAIQVGGPLQGRLRPPLQQVGGPVHGRLRPPHQKAEIVQLLYKVVGRGTRLMAELKPGDRVGMLAPLGHGFFQEEYLDRAREADEVLHVAGGIGIAALLLPARELALAGVRQRLFFGGRTRWDLVGVRDFKPYVTATVLATEDGSRGHRGYVTRPLEEYLERRRDKRFLLMVCGPLAMLQASVELAKKYGHPCLVSMENRMGCALGVCLGCCIRVVGEGHGAYQRVCTEGPVFWAERVVWSRGTGVGSGE
jgi:dihydroorotate dehydrogenase electron transfer subunit